IPVGEKHGPTQHGLPSRTDTRGVLGIFIVGWVIGQHIPYALHWPFVISGAFSGVVEGSATGFALSRLTGAPPWPLVRRLGLVWLAAPGIIATFFIATRSLPVMWGPGPHTIILLQAFKGALGGWGTALVGRRV